jgi:hypothetical protein
MKFKVLDRFLDLLWNGVLVYLTTIHFSSSYATYIRKFKGKESHNVVA